MKWEDLDLNPTPAFTTALAHLAAEYLAPIRDLAGRLLSQWDRQNARGARAGSA